MAASLSNLAVIYDNQGQYGKAEPLYQRALNIREKSLGPNHPDVALTFNNLAGLYDNQGQYGKAEQYYQRSLAIWEKALGPGHPNVATSLDNLASFYWGQDRWSESAADIQRGQQIDESTIQGVMALGDESRKRAYLATLVGRTHRAVTFSLDAHGKLANAESLGLQVVLQRKGRVLDVMADIFDSAKRSLAGEDQKLFDQWRDTSAQYATLSFRGPGKIPIETYRIQLDKLRSETETLEEQLSQRSAAFRIQAETATVERVQQAIPQDAALVEWFRYRPYNPKAKGQEQKWGPPRYVAYILKREGQLVGMDLGDATAIERTLSNLLAALRNRKSTFVGEFARELDHRLMQPLRPSIGEARRIFLSPDGQLNLLPFGVLMDEQQRYLAERWQITYLTSGRDLLRLARATPGGRAPVVIADPDFGVVDKAGVGTTSKNPHSDDQAAEKMKFEPLPGTEAEAKALKDILKLKEGQVLTKDKATETALKQVQRPRILHIATHGFFKPDPTPVLESRPQPLLGQDTVAPPQGENPLLRSGLALAGANKLADGQDGKNDGRLTSLEAAGLDLAGTELAVLSACETGAGSVQNGEGVYGLRRALVLAGVRTLVTSLWKVDDAATKDLMVDYYRRLQAGAGRSQALREAQLAMLKNPARAHPYYWASFIAIGEDRPLGR